MSVGKNLKAVREKLNKTLEEFSVILKCSSRMLRHYESDTNPIHSDMISKLMVDYNVSPQFLFTGEGGMFLNEEVVNAQAETLKNKFPSNEVQLIAEKAFMFPKFRKSLLKLITLKEKQKASLTEVGKVIQDIISPF